MFDSAQFTNKLGSVRGSITNYRRARNGGMLIELTIEEDDRHTALDLVDNDFIVRIDVYGLPD